MFSCIHTRYWRIFKCLSVQLISSHNPYFWKVWHFDGLVNVSSLGCEFTASFQCTKKKIDESQLPRDKSCWSEQIVDQFFSLTEIEMIMAFVQCVMWTLILWTKREGNKTSYWLDNDRVIYKIIHWTKIKRLNHFDW